jgi:uncharacterized protein (DUF1015 family)
MAKIVPFRGILYDREKIQNLRDVITPPYDVISAREQQAYYRRHPQNIIRLILGKVYPQDTEYNNRYTRAAKFFRVWQEQEILVQDAVPAFYVTEIDFTLEGTLRTRSGFIALVELEDFKGGRILPHEKTFSGTKADRLRLMEACKANFGPVFSLFSDPGDKILRALRTATKGIEPAFQFEDLKGYRHRLWRLTDPQLHSQIAEDLADGSLYIADGHHRYETALTYRNHMASKRGTFDRDDPSNFIMMSLSSLDDPGLTIRPVHRLVYNVPQQAIKGFLDKAQTYFHVERLKSDGLSRTEVAGDFLSRIREEAEKGVIGVVLRDHRDLYLLRVKEGIMDRFFGGEIPPPLRKLDVTMATKLVLEHILGFDDTDLDDEERILYTSRTEKALKAVDTGKCSLALILNATRLAQIEEVSKAGLTMPRKSSYFYPKVMTGLVINKIGE